MLLKLTLHRARYEITDGRKFASIVYDRKNGPIKFNVVDVKNASEASAAVASFREGVDFDAAITAHPEGRKFRGYDQWHQGTDFWIEAKQEQSA